MRTHHYAVLLLTASLGCDSDPSKRPLGATCGEPAQCESNLCVSNVCIDPIGCATAFANNSPPGVVEACMVGLQSLAVSPSSLEAAPGSTVQFSAIGTFGSGASGAFDQGGIDPTEPRGGGALTLSLEVDLTAVATWQGGEGVTFSTEGSPGLATIGANAAGSVVVTATVSKGTGAGEDGPRVVGGQASLVIGSDRTETLCADSVDDDGDNLTDCQDPDCARAPECLDSP